MSDDDVRMLGESGVSHMGFGTESTSVDVLKLMNKRHQHLNEMYETARKAALGGIHVTFNLIFGYPGETEANRVETLGTMSDIARQFWNVGCVARSAPRSAGASVRTNTRFRGSFGWHVLSSAS
jgi:tRNA A37 methylthiotransferase MiaB